MAINQGFTSTQKNQSDDTYTSLNAGPYIAVVKVNQDETRMGRLGVYVPAIHGADNVPTDQLITCDYLAPFYGAKSPGAVNETTPTLYENTQHSYGMWMTPPDIDTKVLVIFAEGKITQAYWIGCIQEPFINHMTPGLASSDKSYSNNDIGERFSAGPSITEKYGQENVPVAETNRGIFDVAPGLGFDNLKKPIHPFADTLKNQGLITDDVRGNTTSSARRESPSNVFGISTPGPIDKRSSKTDKIGPLDDLTPKKTTRLAGHTFVMDDGDANGDNQLVRLRTSSGHQLLMHDTAGVVYLANADGTVWMEFSNNGMVDVYAQTGYNLRSGGDINFHAEGNINMYANKSIKIKANEQTGLVSIDGSNIKQIATDDVQIQGTNVYTKASTNVVADAGQRNIQQGATRTDLIGGQVHFNSFGVISNLVPSLQRTTYNSASGTGTALTTHPDVTLQPLDTLYKVDRAVAGMSGMRVPTHEPFYGHQDINPMFGSVGTTTDINTPGFIENANRNADLVSIRWAQYKADLDAKIAADATKPKKDIIESFNKTKSSTFLTKDTTGYLTLSEGAFETYNTITSSIQTNNVDNLTTVLVNESGVLYTKGISKTFSTAGVDKRSGQLSTAIRTVNTVGTLLTGGGQKIEGIVPGLGKVTNSYNNVSKVTETYKNVVGGNVTSVTQVTSAVSTVGTVASKVGSVVKSIGKKFGF